MKDQEQNINSWESGRMRVIEDHKVRRENEQTHRAALSLPGLLEGTALLCVQFPALPMLFIRKADESRHPNAKKRSLISMMLRYTEPPERWSSRKHRRSKVLVFHSSV